MTPIPRQRLAATTVVKKSILPPALTIGKEIYHQRRDRESTMPPYSELIQSRSLLLPGKGRKSFCNLDLALNCRENYLSLGVGQEH